MNYSTFSDILLHIFSFLSVLAISGFLLYGMYKGYILEKEFRLRNRRKYF